MAEQSQIYFVLALVFGSACAHSLKGSQNFSTASLCPQPPAEACTGAPQSAARRSDAAEASVLSQAARRSRGSYE